LKRITFFWLIAGVWVAGALAPAFGSESNGQSEPNEATGEIRLEGKGVKQLVLLGEYGKQERVALSGEGVRLAVGEYWLHEVHLEGGYRCNPQQDGKSYNYKFTVREDEPVVLKMGAPLEQKIKVRRQGCLLVLDYELSGIGGQKYTNMDRSKKPGFVVRKGEEQIISGSFEYG